MAEIEIATGLEENTVGLIERFADVAATDPLSAVLVLVGALITGFAMVVFGGLTLGGIFSAIGRRLPSGQPPQQAR